MVFLNEMAGKKNQMNDIHSIQHVLGSFRDPSGFLYYKDEVLFRQVNRVYKENYDLLMNSGLYDTLIDERLMIPHEECSLRNAASEDAYIVIKPEELPFISYPYEWSFSQLKDAALTTITVQKKAFEFGMTLKDASVYNIQFNNGRALFIDTLSFERYTEGSPWIPYKQFCQHFLGPLALVRYTDVRLIQLLKIHIDGIPLDLISRLLPFRTRFIPSLLLHIHFHAKGQRHYVDKKMKPRKAKLSSLSLRALIESLESAVEKLSWSTATRVWSDYYDDIHYNELSFEDKKQLVGALLEKVNPERVLDLGANVGLFSRIASQKGAFTISIDNDPAVGEANYLKSKDCGESYILPLIADLTNPSPSIGWVNQERQSQIGRLECDTAMALALTHHLAISNNVSFSQQAEFFSGFCNYLIIEYIPKNDPKVLELLSTRSDIFDNYTQECFEEEFSKFFKIESCSQIKASKRVIYLMARL